VEALTGDFAGNLDNVSTVVHSGLDVYAHNIETVEELTPFVRDRRATFRYSLRVLEHAKKEGARITKTSMMLGVGEEEHQIMAALEGISANICFIVCVVHLRLLQNSEGWMLTL
jgi:lipoyl synthase